MGSSTQVTAAGHGVCRIGRSAAFLAEDGVTGSQLSQPITQQLLGFGVDDRHRVGRGRLRLDRVIAVGAGVGAEDLGTSLPHERGGFVGQPLGHRPKLRRLVIRCAHRPIASQVPTGSATSG